MKFEKFKTKDFVSIGMLVTTYMVVFMLIGAVSGFLLPGLAHAFSPAVMALFFGGIVVLFLVNKVPKLGVLSIFSFVLMLFISIFGMGYLPWFISVMVGAILADLLAHTSKYKSKTKNAIAYGLMMVGHSAGGIIPVWFFVESYKTEWLERGMTQEQMQESINSALGYVGVSVLVVSFLGGFLGIYIAYAVLAKHFKKQEK